MFMVIATIVNTVVVGCLCWCGFRQQEKNDAAVAEITRLEKLLTEIETEECGLRRICGDFSPSCGENRIANRILSVIRRWRIGE